MQWEPTSFMHPPPAFLLPLQPDFESFNTVAQYISELKLTTSPIIGFPRPRATRRDKGCTVRLPAHQPRTGGFPGQGKPGRPTKALPPLPQARPSSPRSGKERQTGSCSSSCNLLSANHVESARHMSI